MKISSIIVIAASLWMNAASAETMLRVVFNNGTVTEGLSCDDKESKLISKVFDRPLDRRRNLRSSSDMNHADRPIDFYQDEITPRYGSDDGRDLQAVGSPAYCRDECRGIAAGQCFAAKCGWYNKHRRQLKKYGSGFLSNSTLCQETVKSVDEDLEYLAEEGKLSTTCMALLKAPRQIECYEDVMYGIVEQFSVINADTDKTVIHWLQSRRFVCSGDALNFGIVVNPCVESLNVTLVNKKAGYYNTAILNTTVPGPYTLFGMNGKKDYNGELLPLGNFAIYATPDGNHNKTRVRYFYVDDFC